VGTSIVRRGSTVRVRQRASRNSLQIAGRPCQVRKRGSRPGTCGSFGRCTSVAHVSQVWLAGTRSLRLRHRGLARRELITQQADLLAPCGCLATGPAKRRGRSAPRERHANARPTTRVHTRVTYRRLIPPACGAFVPSEPRVCPRVPFRNLNGKEGVSGSSPEEGLPKAPANQDFVAACPLERGDTFRTHLRYRRRIATSSDAFRHTTSLARHDHVDRQNRWKAPTIVV
jgi:hypothetical protein